MPLSTCEVEWRPRVAGQQSYYKDMVVLHSQFYGLRDLLDCCHGWHDGSSYATYHSLQVLHALLVESFSGNQCDFLANSVIGFVGHLLELLLPFLVYWRNIFGIVAF